MTGFRYAPPVTSAHWPLNLLTSTGPNLSCALSHRSLAVLAATTQAATPPNTANRSRHAGLMLGIPDIETQRFFYAPFRVVCWWWPGPQRVPVQEIYTLQQRL